MAGSPSRTVVVDTNAIVRGAWRLDSAAWRVLLHQARTNQIRLVVPDLVVREAVGRFRDDLHGRAVAVATACDKLGDLVAAPRPPVVEVDVEIAAYENELRSRLDDAGGEVPSLPDVDLLALTQNAVDRRRPFDDKGSGFRDALLWKVVLTTVREDFSEAVALVSNDNKAFADTPKSPTPSLHPDLAVELVDVGFSGQFTLLNSVVAALDWTGIDNPSDTAMAIDVARQQQGELARTVGGMLVGADLPSPWTGVSAQILTAEDVRVELVRTVGADGGLALAHLIVTARIEFEVSFDDHGAHSEHTTATVQFPATASFDSAEQRLADLDVSLPSAEAVNELVELVVPRAPWLALRTAMFPPEVAERFRQATSGDGLWTDVGERFRQETSDGARSDRDRPDDISEGPITEATGQDYDPDQDGDG